MILHEAEATAPTPVCQSVSDTKIPVNKPDWLHLKHLTQASVRMSIDWKEGAKFKSLEKLLTALTNYEKQSKVYSEQLVTEKKLKAFNKA